MRKSTCEAVNPVQYRFKDTGGSRDTHETDKNLTNPVPVHTVTGVV